MDRADRVLQSLYEQRERLAAELTLMEETIAVVEEEVRAATPSKPLRAKKRQKRTRLSAAERQKQVLQVLAEGDAPLTHGAIAEKLGVARSTADRAIKSIDEDLLRRVQESGNGEGPSLALSERGMEVARA